MKNPHRRHCSVFGIILLFNDLFAWWRAKRHWIDWTFRQIRSVLKLEMSWMSNISAILACRRHSTSVFISHIHQHISNEPWNRTSHTIRIFAYSHQKNFIEIPCKTFITKNSLFTPSLFTLSARRRKMHEMAAKTLNLQFALNSLRFDINICRWFIVLCACIKTKANCFD